MNKSRRRKDLKPVSKLRPARPVLSMTTESVLAVAQSLQMKRSAAALAGKTNTIIPPDTPVREAGYIMAENRKAALIIENGELIGLFGFKDMMSCVIAKELSLDETDVQQVMTENPETITPDMTALEALQIMHDHSFITLPVCEEDGRVMGVVDVMDVIYGCGRPEGWRSMFEKSIQMDDISETVSVTSKSRSGGLVSCPKQEFQHAKARMAAPVVLQDVRLPEHIL